ncbi:MAG: hypothetical protein IPN34_16795 [Planctomycetes bacterium]|nr:hypothetical protein [Planctomycetota bacterium]
MRARVHRSKDSSYTCASDATGRFELVLDPAPTAEDHLIVSWEDPGHVTLRRSEGPFTPSEMRELGELVLERSERIAGRVASPSGEALAGVVLFSGSESTTSGVDGRFAFAAAFASGAHSVSALGVGRLALQREVVLPLREELVLLLEAARTIEGFVLDATGPPLEGSISMPMPRPCRATPSVTPRGASCSSIPWARRKRRGST